MKLNYNKTIKGLMMPLMTAMIFLCVSGGKAETPSSEAKEKLIEQCTRQMTETGGDGAGRGMSFQRLQALGADAKSAVSPITSKCTGSNHFKVHHFGWVFSAGLRGWLAR